ncbi:MAG: glycosyltransferase family 9 protein [Chlamydiae bacterium]|nr:glycosyltransferase family 9 protein [Chlamydiota bacterium]
MSFKNYLIFFFIKLVKLVQKKNVKGTNNNFLIVSTTALGDTLWATPSIRLLKEQQPQARIFMLTSKTGEQVLRNNPYIFKIITLDKPLLGSLLKIYQILKNIYFNNILIFHTSQRPILPFCYLLHSDEITATPGINKGLDKLITKKASYGYEHEIIRRLKIAGIDFKNKNLRMEIFPNDQAQLQADSFLKKHSISKKTIVGMHPGAKDKFKQWPVNNFIELAGILKKTFDCDIVVTCGPNERLLAEEITSSVPGSFYLDENLSIHALGSLIQKFDLFITNDTGPMHLAFATGTKTISLFTATDANLCGPLAIDNAVVIQKEKTCSPCIRKKCFTPFCMLQISPREVASCAIKLLKGNTE